MEVKRLCRLEEIPDGGARGFSVGEGPRTVRFFAVRRGDRVFSYWNSCPHVGTPLDWSPDEFLDENGEYLVCSTHGALFQPEDGLCVAGPCQGDRLEPYPVELRDGVLYVEANPER